MNNISSLLTRPEVYISLIVWTVFWKGLALWKSASKRQLLWFIILLVINTLSILEIAYIFFLSRWDIDNGKTLNFLESKVKRKKNNI